MRLAAASPRASRTHRSVATAIPIPRRTREAPSLSSTSRRARRVTPSAAAPHSGTATSQGSTSQRDVSPSATSDQRSQPGAGPERDVEQHARAENCDHSRRREEPGAPEAPVRRRERARASGSEHPRGTDTGEHHVRAEPKPRIGRAAPAERASNHLGVRHECDDLRDEADAEPLRVGPLDRVAHLREPGGARDEQPYAEREQDRRSEPRHELPPGRAPPTAGDLLAHAKRRAAAPRAAPATASST